MDDNATTTPELTLEALQDQLAEREARLAETDAVSGSLLAGEPVDAVEASFAAAAALVERVREQVRRESAASVPAGAPPRAAATPRTAIEKIREGLSRQAPRG